MPSEKSRYIFGKVSPTADFDRGEVLAVLESLGSGAIAERLWQRSETEVSLRRQLGAMVLRSRVSNCVSLGEGEAVYLLSELRELCEFEADWRESDSGWALFLAEVVLTVKALADRVPLESIKPKIREIIQTAEMSSQQMDDCYSCGLEIEQLELVLMEHK